MNKNLKKKTAGNDFVGENMQRNRCYVSLACSIGSISLACGSLLQIPNTTDRISLQRGLFLISLGFIYFISLTNFCNKYLLETHHGLQFRKKYSLMMSDVMDITNKFVSAIQASFSFLVGFIVCKSTCSRSFVYASHFLMEAYGWFGTAYFMYDIWSMYKVHSQKLADKLKLMGLKNDNNAGNGSATNGCGDGFNRNNGNSKLSSKIVANAAHQQQLMYEYDGSECAPLAKTGKWSFLKYIITHPIMMIHHVFIGTFGLLVVTYIRGGGHCIYSYMYMMEFSTPFVSLRGILSTMGLKESRYYIINGLTMLGTFFVCRIFMWPYVMWRYSVSIESTFWQAMTGLPTGCIISIMILFLPQIYWGYLMFKGACKVLLPASNDKKQQQQQQQKQKPCASSRSKNNNLSPIATVASDVAEDFFKTGQLSGNGFIGKTNEPLKLLQ